MRLPRIPLRAFQTRTYATSTITIPASVLNPPSPPSAAAQTPSLPYRVNRTSTNRIPVYHKISGGNNHRTVIRLVEGNVLALKEEVRAFLGLRKDDVVVKPSNQHVIAKGTHHIKLKAWLEEKGF